MSTSTENQNPVTPAQQHGNESSVLTCPSRNDNFKDLNNDELQVLVSLAINTLRDRGVSLPSTLQAVPKQPDIFDNAKFEQIACAGLSSKYDGSPDNLIPTLNAIHIRRQNEVWITATYIMQDGKQLDIVRNFSEL